MQTPGAPAKGAQVEILASRVREGSLQFNFGYLEGQDAHAWQWKTELKKNNVPMMVRVEMDFVSDDEKQTLVPIRRDILIPQGAMGKDENKT